MHFIEFWCIGDRLVDLRNSVQNGRTGAKVRAMKSRRNFSQWTHRSTPLDPKFMFWCVRTILVHLGPFGWHTKLGAKWAELDQKFVPWSRVGIFRNQCTQSTPLDPQIMFWCVLYNFGALGTIWLTYETRCKTGRTGTKVRGTKSHRNFSKWTHLIHTIGP